MKTCASCRCLTQYPCTAKAFSSNRTMTSRSQLLALPREIRDQIIAYLFAETPYDTLDTRRVELRIYNDHAILHRSFVVPPPSWKGCSKLFRTCKQLHHEGMSFLYPQVQFRVCIDGRLSDFTPRRSRLHSEYPVGRLQACTILRYMKCASFDLVASSSEDISRLTTRLRAYLLAVSGNGRLKVSSINLYFDGPQPLNRGSGDDVAKMVKEMKSQTVPRVYVGGRGRLLRNAWDGLDISHS